MNKDSKINAIVFLSLIIIILLLWLGYFVMIIMNSPENITWNEVGDAFGALNTLFSGFAFAGFLVALWMQSKEIRLQKEELKLTRLELEKSVQAQIMLAEGHEAELALEKERDRDKILPDIQLSNVVRVNSINNTYIMYVKLIKHSMSIKGIEISTNNISVRSIKTYELIKSGNDIEIATIDVPSELFGNSAQPATSFEFTIDFLDIKNNNYKQRFEYISNGKFKSHLPEYQSPE